MLPYQVKIIFIAYLMWTLHVFGLLSLWQVPQESASCALILLLVFTLYFSKLWIYFITRRSIDTKDVY